LELDQLADDQVGAEGLGGVEHVCGDANGLIWFLLSDEDAGESELPERAAAGDRYVKKEQISWF
jgi:hypothetical protein